LQTSYTAEEAAEVLDAPVPAVYRWARAGVLEWETPPHKGGWPPSPGRLTGESVRRLRDERLRLAEERARRLREVEANV
jgi:hypothetical protein